MGFEQSVGAPMATRLREEIRRALNQRGDQTALTSQGVQAVPAPLMLGDLVVRECVLAVQRGLEGWAPVESLPDRLRIFAGTIRGPHAVEDEDGFYGALSKVWVSGDAPGIEAVDELGLPTGCERVLTLGDMDAERAVALASHLGDLGALEVTAMMLEGEEVGLPVVARMAAIDGPELNGTAIWGLCGAPIRILVKGGAPPELHVVLDVPYGRLHGGVLGAHGVLIEDVRGPASFREFAMTAPYVLAANLALGRLDDDATRSGGLALGFAGRVSTTFDQQPLGPVELIEEVTTVLPHLARQWADRGSVGDEFSTLVLSQGIAALVARTKMDPVRAGELARRLLAKGLAPHVRDGNVYWIPIGEYPETLPAESLDRVLAEGVEL